MYLLTALVPASQVTSNSAASTPQRTQQSCTVLFSAKKCNNTSVYQLYCGAVLLQVHICSPLCVTIQVCIDCIFQCNKRVNMFSYVVSHYQCLSKNSQFQHLRLQEQLCWTLRYAITSCLALLDTDITNLPIPASQVTNSC